MTSLFIENMRMLEIAKRRTMEPCTKDTPQEKRCTTIQHMPDFWCSFCRLPENQPNWKDDPRSRCSLYKTQDYPWDRIFCLDSSRVHREDLWCLNCIAYMSDQEVKRKKEQEECAHLNCRISLDPPASTAFCPDCNSTILLEHKEEEADQTDPLTYLNQCAALFSSKNEGYSKETDRLANFFNSAPVVHKLLTPFQYAAVLVAKQDDAVWSCITTPNEKKRAELEERLKDGIVYRAIMLALLAREENK